MAASFLLSLEVFFKFHIEPTKVETSGHQRAKIFMILGYLISRSLGIVI